jgi:hypothetical protein
METQAAAGDIERLPQELLAAVISLTSPPHACRAAAVSRTFRAGADSDAVWSHFLPGDLPEFDEGELACTAPSKKALFQCLSNKPALLPCKLLVGSTVHIQSSNLYKLLLRFARSIRIRLLIVLLFLFGAVHAARQGYGR